MKHCFLLSQDCHEGTLRLMLGRRGTHRRAELEYPSHYLTGLDSPVGLVFEVIDYSGDIAANTEASDSGWFTKLPHHMHADQDAFLLEKGYLVA